MTKNDFVPVKFKRDELEEFEVLRRRKGFKSIREMILFELDMKYEDGRKAALRIRSEGGETWLFENRQPVFEQAMRCL